MGSLTRLRMLLFETHEQLSPADHQTHRVYPFDVPPECTALHVRISYAPKLASAEQSQRLFRAALARQSSTLRGRLADGLVNAWQSAYAAAEQRIVNLITPSLDDANGTYRGAGHRHAPDQDLLLTPTSASPGLVAGPLRAGVWQLTLSVHTLVTPTCEVAIQVAAETALSSPDSPRRTA